MAVGVVDLFESIQVHHDDRKSVSVAPCTVDFLFKVFIQRPPIGYPCYGIRICLGAHRLMQAGIEDGDSCLVGRRPNNLNSDGVNPSGTDLDKFITPTTLSLNLSGMKQSLQ